MTGGLILGEPRQCGRPGFLTGISGSVRGHPLGAPLPKEHFLLLPKILKGPKRMASTGRQWKRRKFQHSSPKSRCESPLPPALLGNSSYPCTNLLSQILPSATQPLSSSLSHSPPNHLILCSLTVELKESVTGLSA